MTLVGVSAAQTTRFYSVGTSAVVGHISSSGTTRSFSVWLSIASSSFSTTVQSVTVASSLDAILAVAMRPSDDAFFACSFNRLFAWRLSGGTFVSNSSYISSPSLISYNFRGLAASADWLVINGFTSDGTNSFAMMELDTVDGVYQRRALIDATSSVRFNFTLTSDATLFVFGAANNVQVYTRTPGFSLFSSRSWSNTVSPGLNLNGLGRFISGYRISSTNNIGIVSTSGSFFGCWDGQQSFSLFSSTSSLSVVSNPWGPGYNCFSSADEVIVKTSGPSYMTHEQALLATVVPVLAIVLFFFLLHYQQAKKRESGGLSVAANIFFFIGMSLLTGMVMGMAYQTLNNWTFPLPYSGTTCTILRVASSTCSQKTVLVQVPTPDGVGRVLVTPGSKSSSSSCPSGYPCYFSSASIGLITGVPSPSYFFSYESENLVQGQNLSCWYDTSNIRKLQFCTFRDPNIEQDPQYQFYIGFGFGFGIAFGSVMMTVGLCLRCCEKRDPNAGRPSKPVPSPTPVIVHTHFVSNRRGSDPVQEMTSMEDTGKKQANSGSLFRVVTTKKPAYFNQVQQSPYSGIPSGISLCCFF